MKKTDLLKLKKLISEIESLQDELNRLECKPRGRVVDYAKDYRHGYPRIITLIGLGDENYVRVKQKLAKSLVRAQQERLRIEEWLDGVDDPEMRNILRLQYVNGLTQEEIGDELGYSLSTIKRRLKEFWAENKVDTK